jgi:ribosome maturation factor RimP
MAQETGSQNKNSGFVEFLQKNQIWLIVAVIVVLAGGYFLVTRNDDKAPESTNDRNEQGSEQTDGQNPPMTDENENQNGTEENGNQGQVSGNVTAKGTLSVSDNADRGNLMIESSSGKIYIATKRDFSALIGKEVSLQAEGTLNSFVFLGLNGETMAPEQPDRGGSNESGNVTFTGTLRGSDNLDRGNYTVSQDGSTVYLQTARDYSAWLDQKVTLTATGTLNSFTSARLTK